MRSPNSADSFNDSLRVEADLGSLWRLQAFAATCLERSGGPATLLGKIELVLEELLVNLFNYAYPQESPGQVTLRCSVQGERLVFSIEDQGPPFDPLARDSVDTSLDIDERGIGGLGIHLVRNMVDAITYERRDGSNILSVAFSLCA
ncbi:ATP-binding protein [Desulfoplanes sp.]